MEYLNHVGVLAGLTVLIVQQVLKAKFIPLAFANKYPVPTNIILSTITAGVVVWKDMVKEPTAWTGWILLVTTIGLVAAFTYNHTLKHWAELRATEGEG